MDEIRVAIIDDHAIVRQGLRAASRFSFLCSC